MSLSARTSLLALASFGMTSSGVAAPSVAKTADRVAINDNRTPAGRLADGVLMIRLEVREGEWHPDRDTDPAITVRVFGEEGRPTSIPGPLIRVPEGTEIRATIRNALTDSAVTLHGFSTRGRGGDAAGGSGGGTNDTVHLAPGEVRDVRFIAGAAGTYFYWASAAPGDDMLARGGRNAELSGAFIVDRRGTPRPADRVFVLNLWTSAPTGGIANLGDVLRFTINGKTWPNTERMTYNTGDSVRFRVINTSAAPHPMHLHGFYFRVDSRGNGTTDSLLGPPMSPRLVVTERVAPARTATMTWVPERPGYWLFHCHDNAHATRSLPLDGTPLPATYTMHVKNHAEEMMGGLVMGIEVRPRPGVTLAGEPRERRSLRLVARVDSSGGGTLDNPAYGYTLEERGKSAPRATAPLLPGPTILLRRGEPVAITVVNQLSEATAVHWHGIELDSYYDGVADFAGHPGHIAPVIMPRDSFVARFTPPRAGTFIYHPHADEVRQQQAGLSGALVVLDSLERYDPTHDIVLLVSVPRRDADRGRVLINGSLAPDSLVWRVGERYRLRVIDIHTYRPSMIARLWRDSTLLSWRAVAKDGMDLPTDQATVRPALIQMGNGETFDFEVIPQAAGPLRFAVTSGAGVLLASLPIVVR